MNEENIQKIDISSEETVIEIINVHKWYGDFHVLYNINLKIKKRERIVVCGPSSCGWSIALLFIVYCRIYQRKSKLGYFSIINPFILLSCLDYRIMPVM